MYPEIVRFTRDLRGVCVGSGIPVWDKGDFKGTDQTLVPVANRRISAA